MIIDTRPDYIADGPALLLCTSDSADTSSTPSLVSLAAFASSVAEIGICMCLINVNFMYTYRL